MKNDQDLLAQPRSHAKYEARWQEQWNEDHWIPAPCLPGTETVMQCLMDQSKAEKSRAHAAWDKIAEQEATARKAKSPPMPSISQGQQSDLKQAQ